MDGEKDIGALFVRAEMQRLKDANESLGAQLRDATRRGNKYLEASLLGLSRSQRHVMALEAIRKACDLLGKENEDRTGTDQGVFPGSEIPVSYYGPDGDFHPLIADSQGLDDWVATVADWALRDGGASVEAEALCVAELDAYRQYIEDNLERIERGGWTPVCFDEFRGSEECANYMEGER